MSSAKTVLVLEALGDVAPQDPLRQALDDRRLAYAGLADQDRVVLRLAGKDPDRAPDLVVAADDRVELALPGAVHEVHAVLLERLVGGLGVVGRDALAAAHRLEGVHHLGAVEPEALEELLQRIRPADLDQAEEQVLDADEFVLERLGVLLGPREHVIDGLRHVDLRRVDAARHLGQPLELAVDRERERARGKAHLVDHARDQPVLLGEERREQVPGLDLVVVEAPGDRLGVRDCLARHLGEIAEVHSVAILHAPRHRRNPLVRTGNPHGPHPGRGHFGTVAAARAPRMAQARPRSRRRDQVG